MVMELFRRIRTVGSVLRGSLRPRLRVTIHDHRWPEEIKKSQNNDVTPLTEQEDPPKESIPKRSWWDWSWLIQIARGIGLAGVVGSTLLYLDKESKHRVLDSRISNGNFHSDPNEDEFIKEHIADRGELVQTIIKSFMETKSHRFGIILGPTGTGKTHAIKQACHRNQSGTLYFEVQGVHEFPSQLAKSIGMRIEPSIIGLLLGKYFPPSLHGYYHLPSKYEESLDFVIRSLGERAVMYKRKYGYSPCLIIDGADLLAKYDHKIFVRMVDQAKKCANEGGLRMVFGFSEGHIIPLVHKATSSNSRCKILEVMDLDENEAIKYLTNWGLGKEFAMKVVKEVGSRILFLERAVQLYHDNNNEENIEKIVEELKILFTERGLDAIVEEKPHSTEIVEHLAKCNDEIGFDPKVFFNKYDKKHQEDVRRTMEALIKSNTLRYTSKGKITWHSRLMERSVKKSRENDLK